MKISQQTNISSKKYTATTDSLTNTKGYLRWLPARYSGIQSIFFGVEGIVTDTDYDFEVQLYDVTNDKVLATLIINSTTQQLVKSADIKADLTNATTLLVRYKMEDGSSGTNGTLIGAFLTIVQSDATSSKKTATQLYWPTDIFTSVSTSYAGSSAYLLTPHIEKYDGTIKAYLEAYLWCQATGGSQIQLYDATAGGVVSGSNIQSTSETPEFVQSAELTLVEDHKYYVQYRSTSAGKTAYFSGAQLVVTADGFTKTACTPSQFGIPDEENISGWHTSGMREFLGSQLEADSKSFEWCALIVTDWSEPTDECDVRLLNIGTSGVITSSLHTIVGSEAGTNYNFCYEIEPPNTDFNIAQQLDYQWSYGFKLGRIMCFLEGDLPEYPYYPADPSMPSGYHCFMSQYFKNVNAGRIPLKTPDGVNRLW